MLDNPQISVNMPTITHKNDDISGGIKSPSKYGSKTAKKPVLKTKTSEAKASVHKKVSSDKKPSKQVKKDDSDNRNELEKLYAFMNKYKNTKKNGEKLPYTHALIYEPYGSYNIPDDVYPKFLKYYEDAIVAGYETCITEKHKEYGPIVIDLDFEHAKEDSGRYYTNLTIVNIIKLYNRVIHEYLDVSSAQLEAYVLEKNASSLRGNAYHDGLHIVYPYICTTPSLQTIMRAKFIKYAIEFRIFKKLRLTNNIEDVFDKKVIYNTGWLLYGSKSRSNSHAYKTTHIFASANGKIYDTIWPLDDLNSRSYIKHFINVTSCRRFFSEKDLTPLSENSDPLEIDNQIKEVKNNLDKVKTGLSTELMGNNINIIKATSEDKLIEARNLVNMFSKQRAKEWYTWYQVGRCLHNIDYRLLKDWIKFSKKYPEKFKEGECERLWKKMKPSYYTLATLHYFASRDNPNAYIEYSRSNIHELLEKGTELSHRSIAKLIIEKYKFVYKCASIKHDIWYEFKDHRWIEIDTGYTLRNLISDDLTPEYTKYQSALYAKQQTLQGTDRENMLKKATGISKIINKLNDRTFKNGVLKECADIAYDPTFLKNLDENIYLICFNNGVYDLEADHFRDGCPDDYVSLCTNYDYVEYDENDEYSKEIDSFLEKIQPNKTMEKYIMLLLATTLAGSISEENFYVFTGSGANGKSKLMELLKWALGDYFKPMDIRLLTEKRSSSSSASPEVADKKGIRACPFDEPRSNDEINTGFMKIFTGGDVITARALFREPIYFKPQFKPFLLCNQLPSIKSDDDGTWRRLKVVPFLTKFVKPGDATKKQKKEGLNAGEFWADNSLSEKIPEWKQVFMGKLIQYYRLYRKEGLIHPKLVTQHTNEYRKRCDVFQDFIGDYLDKTENVKDTIPAVHLHEGMRNWYRTNYEGKCPNIKDLRNYLQKRIPTFNTLTDSLTFYKIKTTDGDEILNELDGIK